MATTCLGGKFGIFIILLGNIFAVFAMATSFFTLGLSLKQMYNYDYRVREKYAWMLACFIPLIIFIFISFSKINDAFFRIISITGGIAMTLEGVLIVLMFEKAKKKGNRKPEYSLRFSKIISAVLILVFVMGMIYTILEFLGLMK
jgi:amino acid permease